MRRFILSVCVLLFAQLAAVAIADAATVSYGGSILLAPTNWSSAITIPKFNPALGTLDSISFTLSGGILGTARFENLDAQPSTVTMLLSAQIKMLRPDNSIILVAIPIVATADYVAAFDGKSRSTVRSSFGCAASIEICCADVRSSSGRNE